MRIVNVFALNDMVHSNEFFSFDSLLLMIDV